MHWKRLHCVILHVQSCTVRVDEGSRDGALLFNEALSEVSEHWTLEETLPNDIIKDIAALDVHVCVCVCGEVSVVAAWFIFAYSNDPLPGLHQPGEVCAPLY